MLENLQKIQLEIFSETRLSSLKDGVFVFPQELMSLKALLAIYLNRLFKSNAYQQAIALRGIYFCGDSDLTPFSILGEQELSQQDLTEDMAAVGTKEELANSSIKPEGSAPTALNTAVNVPSFEEIPPEPLKAQKIFFITDLINQKILPEQGLAIPQPQKLITINRVLNVAKLTTLLFVIFGGIGLHTAYNRFINNRNYIIPILGKMNGLLQDLQRLKGDQSTPSNKLFDAYARELMEMMAQFNHTSFFSFFVPASWFSPLGSDLHKSLKVSYQQIIIRTIYIDLLLRARDLLHLRPAAQDVSQRLGQVLNPASAPEYHLLCRYVDNLITLQDKIQKFNTLKEWGNFKDLNDLVVYTFGSQLPNQFAENYHLFQSLLKNTVFPAIDLKPYQNLARETLDVLHQNFIDSLFNASLTYSLPCRIKTILKHLTDDQSLPDITLLRTFSEELVQAMSTLGEGGKTWLDGEYFDFPPDFERFLTKVDNFDLFGKDFTQYLIDKTAVGFTNLKQQFKSINLLLSDEGSNFLAGSSSHSDSKKNSPPSQGLTQLSRSLTKLFEEPYMNVPSGRVFVPLMPPGKIIYWDSKLIQLAYDMAKRFESFAAKEIGSFPPILHEKLKLLARQSLQANIVDLVARAQSFIDIPTNLSQGLAAEEILRSKIADACEVAPKFAKLLEVLNEDSAGFSFVELRDLLASTSYWLLSQVEIMLQNLKPYTLQDPSFRWWNGQQGAALIGYSAYDLEDLKACLQLQRQQIQNMALNYAKPLVTFLTISAMNEAEGDKNLLNRWRRIVEQSEGYAKKQPGNSVNVLEDFIVKELNFYSLKTIFSAIAVDEIQNPSGDYFLESVRGMKKAALSQAEIIRRQQSIENYQELARFFNKFLRNKFPFVGSNLRLTMAEAEPEDIRSFFRKYDAFGGSVQEILNQVYQLGEGAQPAITFLKEMHGVKEFFAAFLAHQGGSDVPSFEFSTDFRVNREREVGGDMIVDWILKPDEDSFIHKSDKVRKGQWIYGNPIQLNFRWPQGEAINLRPLKDPQQPFLSIDEKTASFTFNNKWALLWLLRLQMAHKSEYNVAQLPDPQVLKFIIPLNNSEKAVVYNALTLLLPTQSSKVEGKVAKLPLFPSSAPSLDQEILDNANNPVLTEKQIEAYKLGEGEEDALSPKSTLNPEIGEKPKAPEDKKGTPVEEKPEEQS